MAGFGLRPVAAHRPLMAAGSAAMPRLRHENRRVAADTKLAEPPVEITKTLRETLNQFILVQMAICRVA